MVSRPYTNLIWELIQAEFVTTAHMLLNLQIQIEYNVVQYGSKGSSNSDTNSDAPAIGVS